MGVLDRDVPLIGAPSSMLLVPLVQHANALGLELTVYDLGLDPDGACATRLMALLEQVLAGRHRDLT